MRLMNENKITLNDDQKEVLLKSLKELSFANNQLHEWVGKDALTEDMSKVLSSLIEGHFSTVAKILNYESHLLKEREERHVKIRTANTEIRELQEKLGSSRPVDGLKEQLKYLSDIVTKWWNEEGFNHVGDEVFTPYAGLRARYSFMLDHRHSSSDTPETDRRSREEHIQHLREAGFEFDEHAKGRSEKLQLVDNPVNRKLLRELLQSRFPSAEIHSVKNRVSNHDEDVYVIRDFDATIYDLTDI